MSAADPESNLEDAKDSSLAHLRAVSILAWLTTLFESFPSSKVTSKRELARVAQVY